MKRLILLLFFLLCPIVMAELDAREYLENQPAEIYMPCVNNGSLCTGACNISIYYPNGSEIIHVQPMTANSGIYNYTLSSAYTTKTGRYDIVVNCIDGAYNGATYTFFYVRGRIITTPLEGSRLNAVIISLCIVALSFFMLARFVRATWLKWFAYIISLIQVILIVGISWLNELGASISGLLYIDFISLGIVTGAMLVLGLFFRHTDVLSDDVGSSRNLRMKRHDNWGGGRW